ncbi:lysine-rich nucleolar protein 1-like [Ruditapes philippinarum]|uniref:lysine-rich nucleolar protein 1-like n=1 Tax=Ruditapes philippinarum TaxID=129788 RepID=UPI00295C180A|nr:lysine-rich nucleolar protein 1-like [Ruditapes philippinarum]
MDESEAVMDEAVEQQIKKKKKKKNKQKHKDSDSNDLDDTTKGKQGSVHCERVKTVNGIDQEVDKLESKQKTSRETEIDKSFIKSTENESFKSGQWSSVELGDSDRQNKFFRLLGGFKKGGDTSQIQNKFSLGKKPAFGSSNNTPRRTGGNFAMDKKQEDVYTKALESEYDRAMSMNLNRGIGLGFEKPPEEGKKFYIDTKSSKSIKFDD